MDTCQQMTPVADFVAPSSLDMEFLRATAAEIESAVDSAIPDTPENEDMRRGILMMTAKDDVRRFVHGEWANSKWDSNARMVTAIRNGIKNGDIELSGRDDLEAFRYLMNETLKIFFLPQVVEYYANREELMDLFRLFSEEWFVKNGTGRIRVKLYRIYAYDMGLEAQCLDELPPLEIRLSFSDFDNDDMTEEESLREEVFWDMVMSKDWDKNPYVLDHTKPETLQGLEKA